MVINSGSEKMPTFMYLHALSVRHADNIQSVICHLSLDDMMAILIAYKELSSLTINIVLH